MQRPIVNCLELLKIKNKKTFFFCFTNISYYELYEINLYLQNVVFAQFLQCPFLVPDAKYVVVNMGFHLCVLLQSKTA